MSKNLVTIKIFSNFFSCPILLHFLLQEYSKILFSEMAATNS